MVRQKIISYPDLEKKLSKVKKKKVVVGGCFDILHIGHIRFLKQAKKRGDILIVLLESDEFIKKKKKRQPFHTQKERVEILAGLEDIDYIIPLPLLNSDDDYLRLVKIIKPQIIAVTENDSQIENKKKQAKVIKAKVEVVIPYDKGPSTTSILKYLS